MTASDGFFTIKQTKDGKYYLLGEFQKKALVAFQGKSKTKSGKTFYTVMEDLEDKSAEKPVLGYLTRTTTKKNKPMLIGDIGSTKVVGFITNDEKGFVLHEGDKKFDSGSPSKKPISTEVPF